MESPKLDIEGLGLLELKGLQQKVKKRIEVVERRERRRAEKELNRRRAELGITRAEAVALFANKTGVDLEKSTVKYRNPESGQEWGGSGRKPNWVKSFEAGGGDLDDLVVVSGTDEGT